MKKTLLIFLMLLSMAAQSFAAPYDQCGGYQWTGMTTCSTGYVCVYANAFFSQCLPEKDPLTPVVPPDPTQPPSTGAKFEKEVFTGQKLVVTSVTGQAAISAGIKIGQILNLDTSAAIKAAITANLKDCYKMVCYQGGTCNCTSLDWTVCVSGGCPSAGTSCK